MNPRFRIAVVAGVLLVAGVARAGAASSAVPMDAERTLEAPRPSVPYLDYANCPTPRAQQDVQIKAALQVPDQDRGSVVDKGGCAAAMKEEPPTKVDDRYSIGE